MVSLGRMSVSTYGLNLAVAMAMAMAMAMANGPRQSGRSALSACPPVRVYTIPSLDRNVDDFDYLYLFGLLYLC